jgi:hypothetical protein
MIVVQRGTRDVMLRMAMSCVCVELWSADMAATIYSAHYVRKAHSRHAHTKNEDAQIMHLRSRVSHYRVIKDVRSGASLISIHGRCATLESVTYLIVGWGTMPLIRDAC